MNQCQNCGKEFEGNFCPVCGTPLGQTPPPKKTETGSKSFLFRALAYLPLALCTLFGAASLFFCLAPYGVMKDFLFDTGETESLGSLYALGGSAVKGIIAFAAIGLAVSLAGLLFSLVKRLSWREIFGVPVGGLLSFAAYPVWIGSFACACAICADVNKSDGGLGALSVGAGPILIIVFALLFALLAAAAQTVRLVLKKKSPALAQEEKDARKALREKYAKPPFDPYGEEGMLSHVFSVIRLKKFTLFFLLGTIFGPAAPVLWILAFVFLFKKPNLKKEASAPVDFLRENRGKMIASAICNLICAVLFTAIPVGVTCALISSFDIDVPMWSRAFLQVAGGLHYLPPTIAAAVASVFLLFFGTLTVLCIASAVYCGKVSVRAASVPRVPLCRLQQKAAKARPAPLFRFLKRGAPLAIAADILVAVVAISSIVGTNLFTPSKLSKIAVGAPQSAVTRVLGDPVEQTANEWVWYSDNYVSLYKEMEKLEGEMERALLAGNENRSEQLLASYEKLSAKAEKLQYRMIRVLFNAEQEAVRVEMTSVGEFHDLAGGSGTRQAKAKLFPASIPFEKLGETEFYYQASFERRQGAPDYAAASLDLASATVRKVGGSEGITGPGAYTVTWDDALFPCSAELVIT